MATEETIAKIKELVVSSLDLEDVSPSDIETEAPLFGEGLGLDSIDALEIGAALRKKYQVKFKANSDENRVHFRTVASLADFIAANAGLTIEG